MILFSAPRDFDPAVEKEYEKLSVVWGYAEPVPNDRITVWVCDPSAKFTIDSSVLCRFPNLKTIATPSTGNNHIDLDACRQRGIKVRSLLDDRAGLETISASAEFTLWLLLGAFRLPIPREIQGRHIGLIGYGRIGKRLKQWLTEMGAVVSWYDLPHRQGVCPLESIFEKCDGVVVCCALTPETRGMITKEHLLLMKENAVLVNTARAEIINEQNLYSVLSLRPDLRYATDVVHGDAEGRGDESLAKLMELGAMVTPHIAGATFDSRTKAARIILELLKKEL